MKHIFFQLCSVINSRHAKYLKKQFSKYDYDIDIIYIISSKLNNNEIFEKIQKHITTLDSLFYDQDLCISIMSDDSEKLYVFLNSIPNIKISRKSGRSIYKGVILFINLNIFNPRLCQEHFGFRILNLIQKNDVRLCFERKNDSLIIIPFSNLENNWIRYMMNKTNIYKHYFVKYITKVFHIHNYKKYTEYYMTMERLLEHLSNTMIIDVYIPYNCNKRIWVEDTVGFIVLCLELL